jgi:hypothetical protein
MCIGVRSGKGEREGGDGEREGGEGPYLAAKDRRSNPKFDVEVLECIFGSHPVLEYHVQSSISEDEVSCSSNFGWKNRPSTLISVNLENRAFHNLKRM